MVITFFFFISIIASYIFGYRTARDMRIEEYEEKIEELSDQYTHWKSTHVRRMREVETSVRQQVQEQVDLLTLSEKRWQDDTGKSTSNQGATDERSVEGHL